MALLLIAFVAGLLTVLAPCTLPLLPVIVGGSIGEAGIRRPLVIAVSLGVSVFLFTLALKASTLFINVPQSFWNIVSGGLLIAFGLVTLFPALWDHFVFANILNKSSNRLLAQGYTRQNFIGDVIIGAALGPVFSSCSPTYFIVLATVLPVHPAQGVIYLFAYCTGLILSLLAVAVLGQRLLETLGIASDPRGWFKRTIGALFLILGIVIVSGYSTQIESGILSHSGVFDVTQIEQRLLGAQSADNTAPMLGLLSPEEKAIQYQKAPELAEPDAYINTAGEPVTLASLKGKVVLIDFWTYSCINCLRTLPYLEAWYQKYKDQGLIIIGVHTPEFAFEHILTNVQDAVNRLGITYPVLLDNEYATWNAFGNRYWPNEYLIDIDGYVVHNHAGEGEYDVTEKSIQQALAERAARAGEYASLATSTVDIPEADLSAIQSPETYFGSSRNEYFGNGRPGVSGTQTFVLPGNIAPNTLYLGGVWNLMPEYAQSQASTSIVYYYSAHDLNFVASAPVAATVKILLDGKPVGDFAGSDVDSKTSTAVIRQERLYNLVHSAVPGPHTIQIQINGVLQAYTFTFG